MKMQRGISVAAAVALLVIAVTGCQKKEAAAPVAETIKLELYYYKQENQEGLKNIVKAFEAANPGITIDMIIIPNDSDAAMSARAAQNDLPDIMQMQSYARVQEYASQGYLVDLTDTEALGRVISSSLPAVTWNGRQYALPMDFAGIGIVYNKKIFSDLNLQPPETYRDLEQVCATLKKNGIVPFAALLKENWSAGHFITLVHTALLKEKNSSPADFIKKMNSGDASYGDVDTKRLFSILDFYRKNMNDNAEEMGGSEQQQSFANGEAAMMVQGLWSYVDARNLNPNLDAGFIPFPVYNDASLNVMYADIDSTFGISSQSSKEQQDASIQFINWLSSYEGQRLWVQEYKLTHSFIGGQFSALGVPYDDLMNSVAKKGSYPWAFSQYPSEVFEDACKNGAQQYMMHRLSAHDVIERIDAQWEYSVQ